MGKAAIIPNGKGLTEKQEEFCQQYLIDLSGEQAALRAGYSEKAAQSTAYKLLRKATVQDRIAELKHSRIRRTMVTQDEVLVQWAKSAMFDYRSLFNADGSIKLITEMDDICGQMITGAKVKQVSRRVYNSDSDDEGTEVVTVDVIEVKILDKHTSLTNLAHHMDLLKPADDVGETARTLSEIVDRLVPTVGPTCELPSADPDSVKH